MTETPTHPDAAYIQGKIMELRTALEAQVPNIGELLKIIHDKVKSTPELCMVLSEEEIAVCVKGYEKQSQVTIIAEKMKGSKKLKAGDITPDMI